jgi:hypothetical protein
MLSIRDYPNTLHGHLTLLEAVVGGAEEEFELEKAEGQKRDEEWIQHLVDLEYLKTLDDVSGGEDLEKAYRAAVQTFKADAVSAGLLDGGENDASDTVALQLLCDLLSFDGEAPLRGLPTLGSRNLLTRVLHYRLKALGLYDESVAARVSSTTRSAVQQLGVFLGLKDGALPNPAILGDIPALYRALRDAQADPMLVFRDDSAAWYYETADYATLVFAKGKLRHNYLDWYLRLIRPNTYREGKRQLEGRGSKFDRIFQPVNRFGLSLVQLRLWVLGFYHGRIDGWWGPSSHEALREALRSASVEPTRLLVSIGDGLWALDFKRVFQEVLAGAEEHALTAQRAVELLSRESPYIRDENARPHPPKRTIWDRILGGFRKLWEAGRRIYFGARALIRSAIDGLRRGFRWVREKIAAPLYSFFKFLFRGVREGCACCGTR